MKKKFLKITSGFTALFFGISLFVAPASFAELRCWNDASLSLSTGGTTGATSLRKGDFNKKNKTEIADPVDVSNGNYFYQKEDVSIPSRGMPLKITRIYNSLDIYDGPFGIGWSHNYNIFLLSISDGNEAYVLRRNADGSKDKFLQNADGSYTASPGCYDTLVKDAAGYTIWDKHGLSYRFGLDGQLISITDRNLNQTSLGYDSATRVLTKVTDSCGRYIIFTYNPNHKVGSVRDFSGRVVTYTYDGDGNLSGSIAPATEDYPDGVITTYTYKSRHRLESITDPKSQRYVSLEYDSDDRVSSLTYGFGTYYFNYQPNLTIMTDPKGFKTDYILNADGTVKDMKQYSRYVRSPDPSYYLTSYVYNANRERVKILYPSGSWAKYIYDNKGNLLEIRKKKKGASDIDDPTNDVVTRFTCESWFNFVKTMRDPNGNTTTYYYDYEEVSLGDLNGDGVTNENNGNLVRISYPPVGWHPSEIKFTYNSYGQVLTAIDPNGNVVKYEYNSATGYLAKATRGFGTLSASVTEMGYDPVGNIATVKDGRGSTTTFGYDSHNNLIRTTAAAPFSYVINYKYDANDNLIQLDRQTGDAANPWQTTYYAYNILDKLETIRDDLGNTTIFDYDANGNRSLVRDAELNSTNYEYDERNLLWRVTDSLGNITEYAYDENGNLNEIKDANSNITGYAYDDFDRLTAANYADGTGEGYWYDNASNLVRKSTRSQGIISYKYDSLNRVMQKTTPETVIDYIYDVGSRLESATNQDGAISYTYDALNRVKTVSYPEGKAISYDYDSNSNRTKLTYPDSIFITYEYDNLNRLTDIKDTAAQAICHYDYDALSRRSGKVLLNGTSSSYTYDAINRLSQLTNRQTGQSNSFSEFNYPLYDKVGNRRTSVSLRSGTGATDETNYTYDRIYQLKTVDYPVDYALPDTTFNYDPVGNRTSTVSGGTTNYTPNNLNQYTQVGGISYLYDLNGNLTNIATNSYSYDSENRLINVVIPAQAGIQYTYDPFGRRISKTVNGVTTKFLYDGDQIIAEYDGSDNLIAKYIYGAGIDEIIEKIGTVPEGGLSHFFYHYDGLGSITNLTDSTGTVAESYSYDVFGKPSTTSSIGNRYMFTGREYDAETGLYYYRARYYSAELGRFLQADPIGCWGGINLYAYCFNNPVILIDPFGLKIVAKGNKEEKEKIREDLKKLKKNSTTAEDLIDKLEKSPEKITVETTTGGNSYSPDGKVINYNPNKDTIYDGTEKWQNRPPEVGLGHELVHAEHDVNGGIYGSRSAEENKTVGLGSYANDTHTENKIRNDYGLPRRPRY